MYFAFNSVMAPVVLFFVFLWIKESSQVKLFLIDSNNATVVVEYFATQNLSNFAEAEERCAQLGPDFHLAHELVDTNIRRDVLEAIQQANDCTLSKSVVNT